MKHLDREKGKLPRGTILVLLSVASALAGSCTRAPSDSQEGIRAQAGPFRVEARFDPDPPQAGQNVVRLRILDDGGEPVTGATVRGAAVMPSMGAMPEMRAGGGAEDLGEGRYRLGVDLAMNGSWPLTLTIEDGSGRRGSFAVHYKTGVPVRLAGAKPSEGTPTAASEAGTIELAPRQRQLIGLETERVERRSAEADIRAVGRVAYDETGLTDVTLKFQGWIGEVFVNTTGAPVRLGEPLFTVYAPELLSAQEEFLESTRRGSALRASARRRLLLWNLSGAQIDELAARGEPRVYVPIDSPASGVVVEKNVVDGSAVKSGELLYRIADLDTVWIEAEVYEADLPLVKVGAPVEVTLTYVPGRTFEGRVDYVYPYLDAPTRTGRIRIVVPNADGALKPGMYADVDLTVALGEQVVVPEAAVLRSGKTDLVFLDLGDGRLAPRRVRLGRRTRTGYVVEEGLVPGDVVVTSGNFLVAAESKLKAGIEKW